MNKQKNIEAHALGDLQKGVTLIALIITIIVMLILVGVSVNIALGNGLFKSVQNAAIDTETAKLEEKDLSSGKINVNNQSYDSIDDYITILNGRDINPNAEIGEYVYYEQAIGTSQNIINQWRILRKSGSSITLVGKKDSLNVSDLGFQGEAFETSEALDEELAKENTLMNRFANTKVVSNIQFVGIPEISQELNGIVMAHDVDEDLNSIGGIMGGDGYYVCFRSNSGGTTSVGTGWFICTLKSNAKFASGNGETLESAWRF